MILAKGPTARHVYERAQHFLQNDPDLQGIANDFTQAMFMVQGIEVLGTPLGTDLYVRNFVAQNCINITRDVEKLEPLSDGFIHFQLIQKTMNTAHSIRVQISPYRLRSNSYRHSMFMQTWLLQMLSSRKFLEVLSSFGARMIMTLP
jgi:hypothetical protein